MQLIEMSLVSHPLQCSADSVIIVTVLSHVSACWYDETLKFIICSPDSICFN